VSFTCLDVAQAAKLTAGRKSGAERLFQCPNHDDANPSLSINATKDVFLCVPCGAKGTAWQLAAFLARLDPSDKGAIVAWLQQHGLGNDSGNGARARRSPRGEIIAVYPFTDEVGNVVYEEVRYSPKDFRQRRPDGRGGYIWNLDGVQPVPFRLPQLLKSSDPWIVEGAKDVLSLEGLGFTATTNAGGAGKWPSSFSKFFSKEQNVVVLRDNDPTGLKHALKVLASLHGYVASLKFVELPNVPAKGDVSDWIGQRRSAGIDDDAIAEELIKLADATPEWRPESGDPEDSHSFPVDLVMSAPQLVGLSLPLREDIISTVLYEQSLSMIYAKRGLGKTRCALTLVDAVTKAEKWFAWTAPCARRCLFIDGELPAVELRGMVREMCGEPSPLLDLVSSEFFFASQKRPLTLSDRDHQVRLIGLLEQLEKQHRRPALIVFDNLSSMTFGLDENANTEQDAILPFLLELRHRGFAPTFIHHTGHNIEQQRGASRREDFLDLSIRLTPLADRPGNTCQFKLEFSKVRRKPPTPSSIECELIPGPNGRLVWTVCHGSLEIETWVQCLRLCQTMKPESQAPIADVLKIAKGTVSKCLTKAREKGLLEGLQVTLDGERYLAKVYAADCSGPTC
jgi:hypothetical protein